MQAVVTIEQFQEMMKSEKEDSLLALFRSISTSITPADVRKMTEKTELDPVYTWAGWR